MRRSQTTRSVHRPSHSGSQLGDFGVLPNASFRGRPSMDSERGSMDSSTSRTGTARRRDGTLNTLDLSTKYEDPEDGESGGLVADLRQQLRDAEKEIERLASITASLRKELDSRPPLEKVLALQKEQQELDLLLQHTQKENQNCMLEIENGKRRERIMEAVIVKVHGESWMEDLRLENQLNPSAPSSSPVLAARTPAVAIPPRRPSVVTRGLSQSSHRHSPSVTTLDNASRPASPQISSSPRVTSGPSAAATPATSIDPKLSLPDHLEQIRSLVLAMDSKLKTQETKLQGMVTTARAEEKKYERLVAATSASVNS